MAELATLREYITQIEQGLAKLPPFEGKVFRIIKRVSPEDVASQFLPGQNWKEAAFLSASAGKPLDSCRVMLTLTKTNQGRSVMGISEVTSEHEILFPPAIAFRVVSKFEPPGFLYVLLEQL